MTGETYTWDSQFLALFDKCAALYGKGDREFNSWYSTDDQRFLDSIGYKPREFFDFIEDYCGDGEPSPSTAVLVAAVRRDYFLVVQKGKASRKELNPDDLPARDATLGGMRWLPRILAKARAKLRGELHPDLMYGCGGDRGFLSEHDLHPADFLRAVWAAGDDDHHVVKWIAEGNH